MGLSKQECVNAGLACYHLAIDQAEADLRGLDVDGLQSESVVDSAEKVYFTAPSADRAKISSTAAYETQLANRLFNRALLLCTDDGASVTDGRKRAAADLQKSQRHDARAIELAGAASMTANEAGCCEMVAYETAVARMRMLSNVMLKTPAFRDALGAEFWSAPFWKQLFAAARKELARAEPLPDDDLTAVGKMQLLDAAEAEYHMFASSTPSGAIVQGAAVAAARMFIEDEYVITSAALAAGRALAGYFAGAPWESAIAADFEGYGGFPDDTAGEPRAVWD